VSVDDEIVKMSNVFADGQSSANISNRGGHNKKYYLVTGKTLSYLFGRIATALASLPYKKTTP
jgi:hypothetical protein